MCKNNFLRGGGGLYGYEALHPESNICDFRGRL